MAVNFIECKLEEGSSSSSEEVDASTSAGTSRRGHRALAALLAVPAVLGLLATASRAHRDVQRGDTTSSVSFFGVFDASKWAEASIGPSLKQVRDNIRGSKAISAEHLASLANLTGKKALTPKEHMNDGNQCNDDEEEFGGLCYAKCSALTGGTHTIRTTAFACCAQEPCTFFNSKFTSPLSLCDGFDIAGAKEDRACPHAPGSCLANEEFDLGMCYKKCAILTNNTYPFRSGGSTCCMYNSHWACTDAVNVKTSPDFNIGGGAGDGDKSTPNQLHPPMPELTEAATEA